MRWIVTFVFTIALIFLTSQQVSAASAVILQYHHVSEKMPPSTSVSPETFAAHMKFLHENTNVLPLTDVIKAILHEQTLPEKTVAITFDDGYKNILENAHPILREYGFNYTIFINPALVGSRQNLLTWEEVKTMSTEQVIFANHYLTHKHLLQKTLGQSEAQWLETIESELLLAESQLAEKLGYSHKYLAYPFGEFNPQIQSLLTELNFVGFGQHSGAISKLSDFTALPRFPASGIYANLNTLKTKIFSLAMPVLSNSLPSAELTSKGLVPEFSLELDTNDLRLSQFACFFQGDLLPIQKHDNKVTFKINQSLPAGRSRVNCTAPSIKEGRYYWYSQPWFVPTEEGIWLD